MLSGEAMHIYDPMSVETATKIDPFSAMHVNWSLMGACNYGCAYCPAPREKHDCVYVRERVMRIAARIIERPRPLYDIVITGGEPTLHPFLPDILRYFFSSGRNVYVTLETNGSQGMPFYQDLLKNLPKSKFRLSLGAHPALGSLRDLLLLASFAVEQGQLAHFRLANDPLHQNTARIWYKAMQGLSEIVPVTLEWFKAPALPKANSDASGEVSEKTVIVELEDEQTDGCAIATRCMDGRNAGSQKDPAWHVTGGNLLLIEPNGRFRTSCAGVDSCGLPLWHERAELPRVHAEYFRSAPHSLDGLLPRFASRAEAEVFCRLFTEAEQYWSFANGPLNGVARVQAGSRDLARARYRRLRPDGHGGAQIPAEPNLAWREWKTIEEIYTRFADAASRQALLRLIRAVASGDARFLPPADTVMPQTGANAGRGKYPERLAYAKPPSLEALKKDAAQIREYLPELFVALPWDGRELVAILAWLTEKFPGYRFTLGFTNSAPVLKGAHERQPQPYPALERISGMPPGEAWPGVDFTAIVSVTGDEADTRATVDSLLMQGGESLEIILLNLDSGRINANFPDWLAKDCPQIIKALSPESPGEAGLATDQAVNLATGRSVLFLRSGDILPHGFLAAAETAMRRGCDICVSGSGEKAMSFGLDSLNAFLAEWASGSRTAPYVFSMRFLAEYNIRHGGDGDALRFASRAFRKSRKTCYRPLPVCQVVGEDSCLDNLGHLAAFERELRILGEIFAPGDTAENLRDACEAAVWRKHGQGVLGALREGAHLQPEGAVGSVALFGRVLGEYAGMYCAKMGLRPTFARKEESWETDVAPILQSQPGAGSGGVLPDAPELSVIIYHQDSSEHLNPCISSVLNQAPLSVEIILVDNASDGGHLDAALDYMDFEPHARVYTSDREISPDICRRQAVGLARGKYLLFLNAESSLEEHFLADAVRELQAAGAAAALYNSAAVAPDGARFPVSRLKDGNAGCADILDMCGNGEIERVLALLDADVCRRAINSPPRMDVQTDSLMVAALNGIPVITRARCGLLVAENAEKFSPFRPVKPWEAEEALRCQVALLENMTPDTKPGLSASLCNRLLPAVHACVMNGLQFSGSDVLGASLSRHMWEALLAAYASDSDTCKSAWVQADAGERAMSADVLVGSRVASCAGGLNELAGENGLAANDLLRGAAILNCEPETDLVCFAPLSGTRTEELPKVCPQSGKELLQMQFSGAQALLFPQMCLGRKEFLDGVCSAGRRRLDGFMRLWKALSAARRVAIEYCDVNPPDFAAAETDDFISLTSELLAWTDALASEKFKPAPKFICRLAKGTKFGKMLARCEDPRMVAGALAKMPLLVAGLRILAGTGRGAAVRSAPVSRSDAMRLIARIAAVPAGVPYAG